MKHSRIFHTTCILISAVFLASCASTPPAPKLSSIDWQNVSAYLGKPVRSFSWVSEYYQGHYAIAPDKLVVQPNLYGAFLITVAQPCPNLQMAENLEFTRNVDSDSVYTHYDSVKTGGYTCVIDSIRPIKLRRMENAKPK